MTSWLFGILDAFHRFVERKESIVKRQSEALENLLSEFKLLGIDNLLKGDTFKNDETDDVEELDSETNAHDLLIFLTKVCYRKRIGIIGDDEFQFFRGYIEMALQNDTVCKWITDYHNARKIGENASPYLELLKYGKEINMPGLRTLHQEIDAHTNLTHWMQGDKQSRIIHKDDGVIYRTHLDVLNGIFNKGLLRHGKGGSPVKEGVYVWFPHIRNDGDFLPNRKWNNSFMNGDNELIEHCNDASSFGKCTNAPSIKRRYVFATFDNEAEQGYKFMGIYEFVKKEPASTNEFRWVYRRSADSFNPDSI